MISANIKIVHIDYENTFRQVFPIFKEKLCSMESKNMIIQLFQKLDDVSLPVLLGIMSRLSETTKNEFLVLCLNTYSAKIQEKLNEELAKNPYGKYLNVGTVSIVQEREVLYLWIGHVQVDYKELAKEKLPGRLGDVASFFVGKKLEKMALEILWTEESKQKLIELAKTALDKYGFVMDLADIQVMQDTEESVDAIEVEEHLKLTEEMEMDILDALAGYLKDKTVDI